MLKKILNLDGTHILGKKEQSSVKGGYDCHPFRPGLNYGKCTRPAPNPSGCYYWRDCNQSCDDGSMPIC